MNDMSQVIIPKSDQWNADDFLAGPMTFTIREVRITPGSEQPVNILLEGTDKFYRPCKSMSRVLVGAWGADAKAYVGRSLTLYRDPEVKWGGLAVGGIRISHMSHLDGAKTMVLTATKGSRKPFKVMPLVDAPQTKDDPAAKWANGYIAKMPTLDSMEAVNAFADEKAAKLAELQAKRPELHQQVMAALDARKAELGASSFDDDFAGPDDEEGEQREPDPQTNDQGEEKTAAEIAVERVVAELAASTSLKEVAAIEKANAAHRAFLPEHLDEILETSIQNAKKRVEKVEAE
jgi:hypothetical protein